jgi:predicted ATPase
MSIPGGFHYEITESAMTATPLEELEHYSLTKGFLNNPDLYLRHLG